jgi:hypothetical protein
MNLAKAKRKEETSPVIVGGVSRGLHQMAQPLTVLQGTLELALMQLPTADESRQWLEAALEQACRLASDLAQVQKLVNEEAKQ